MLLPVARVLKEKNRNFHFTASAPVEIGEYTWICSRSIVLPDIKTSEGAIVSSGVIVTKDVPDYAIVAGSSATIIGLGDIKEY